MFFGRKTKFDPKLGEVEKVARIGGVDYYKFVNEQKIPALRAFAAMDIYAELEMRLSSEYLDAMLKSIRIALNKGNLVDASAILSRAEMRKENISNSHLLYKMASVRYFDENENPAEYDDAYNFKKIQRWMSEDINGFFLKLPITDLVPSFNSSGINFRNYTRLEQRQLIEHLTLFIRTLSENEENKDTISRLQSWMETLKRVAPYSEKEYTTTMSPSSQGLRTPEIKQKINVAGNGN